MRKMRMSKWFHRIVQCACADRVQESERMFEKLKIMNSLGGTSSKLSKMMMMMLVVGLVAGCTEATASSSGAT